MMPHSVLYLLLLSTLSTMSCVKIKKGSRLSGTISSQDDTWARDSIPVCFEQQAGYDQDKATIQDVVTAEFAKADIFFEGWQLCQEGQKGIRIRFDRDATFSHTTGFGREIDGVYAGMILGSKTSCSMPFTGSHCQKNMALHEFGHALHGMLANTKYSGLSGTNVYWDFVELPSQVLENWCYEKEAIELYKGAKTLFKDASMNLREWLNCANIFYYIFKQRLTIRAEL